MKQEHIAELPKLYDASGDLAKDWHVEFRYRNPLTGKMVRIRKMDGLSKMKSHIVAVLNEKQKELIRKQRYDKALLLIEEWSGKLRKGYNPFRDERLIYGDDLKTITRRKNEKTIAEYLEIGLGAIIPGLENKTVLAYNKYLNNFITWIDLMAFTERSITSFEQGHAERFLNYLITDLKHSPKYRNEHLNLIRQCFDKLKKLFPKLIRENPFSEADKKKHTRKKSPIYQPALRNRVRELLPKCDPQLWLFVQFEYYTGLRPHVELRQLQLKEIDLIQGLLLIPADKAKDDADRVVTIPVQLHEQLLGMNLHELPQEYYLFTRDQKPGPKICGEGYFGDRWKSFRTNNKIPTDFKLYAFKHTGATAADNSGIDRKEIQNHLGHSSMQQTEEYLEDWESKVNQNIRLNYPTL